MSARLQLPEHPPLQNGDRLGRLEFERRYHAHPTDQKFELIEGVVYMSSPVTHEFHSGPHFEANGWTYLYTRKTPGVLGGDNATIKLNLRSEPQPDGYLIIDPACGGQVRIDSDGYIVGAPELVLEVSASTASLDANAKRRLYEASGVREYVLWRVYDSEVEWFVSKSGVFQPLAKIDGIYRSEVLPGLWLDPAALLNRDFDRIDEVSKLGLAAPEHAAFVAELNRRVQGSTP